MDSLACVGGQSRMLYSASCSAFVIICKVACGCLLLFLREILLRMCYVRGRHGFKPAGESASSVDGSRTNVICGIYTLGNNTHPGAQTSQNCQPSCQNRTHSICPG